MLKMSQSPKLSNEEYLKIRDDSRLVIKESDVSDLVGLAEAKGYKDADIATLYVVAAEGIPEETQPGEYELYEEADLKKMAETIERLFYDEKNKRLVGFLPPLPTMVEK